METSHLSSAPGLMNFIALKILTADRAKFGGLILAIAFSTFLLSHQVSMFFGILERTTSQIRDVSDADIWVMDPQTEYMDETIDVRPGALAALRSVPGVAWASPFYKGYITCKAPTGRFRQCILLGVDDASLAGASVKMVAGSPSVLRDPDAIIMDAAGFRSFFPNEEPKPGKVFEINRFRAVLTGISDASPPFQTFPVVLARNASVNRFLGKNSGSVPFLLARAKAGVPLPELLARIEKQTGLKAMTTSGFAQATVRYYLKHTGIPANFGIVVAVAILVGVAVAGQTLYLFTAENLKTFTTMKALGMETHKVRRIVLIQAGCVGNLGYAFGVALTAGFFVCTQQVPDLRGFRTYPEVLGATWLVMMSIVFLASLASLRAISRAEPALVFRTA